jgi:hypothetical protein
VLAEYGRVEASKKELNEGKAVADEESIAARNQQLSQIAAEGAQLEQNTTQYRSPHEAEYSLYLGSTSLKGNLDLSELLYLVH